MLIRIKQLEDKIKQIFEIRQESMPDKVTIYKNGCIEHKRFSSDYNRSCKFGCIYDSLLSNELLEAVGCPDFAYISYYVNEDGDKVIAYKENTDDEKETTAVFPTEELPTSRETNNIVKDEAPRKFSLCAFFLSFIYYAVKKKWAYFIASFMLSVLLPLKLYPLMSFFTSYIYYEFDTKEEGSNVKLDSVDVCFACLIAVTFIASKAILHRDFDFNGISILGI